MERARLPVRPARGAASPCVERLRVVLHRACRWSPRARWGGLVLTKIDLLSFVLAHEAAAAREVAAHFAIDIHKAAAYCHRGWSRGYLRRESDGRRLHYTLSARGRKHLHWLLTHQRG